MLVYQVTLYSIYFKSKHTREVYIDSKDKESAERRLLRTFDNITSYEFLRKDILPGSQSFFLDNTKKSSTLENMKEFLKGKKSVTSKTLKNTFNIDRSNLCMYLKKLGYKYDSLTKCYILK